MGEYRKCGQCLFLDKVNGCHGICNAGPCAVNIHTGGSMCRIGQAYADLKEHASTRREEQINPRRNQYITGVLKGLKASVVTTIDNIVSTIEAVDK